MQFQFIYFSIKNEVRHFLRNIKYLIWTSVDVVLIFCGGLNISLSWFVRLVWYQGMDIFLMELWGEQALLWHFWWILLILTWPQTVAWDIIVCLVLEFIVDEAFCVEHIVFTGYSKTVTVHCILEWRSVYLLAKTCLCLLLEVVARIHSEKTNCEFQVTHNVVLYC